MELATIDLIKTIATEAIKILGPAGITAYVAYRTLRTQFEIERLRLHDKDRTEAHKRLFTFARKLSSDTFPLAEDKRLAFIELMRKEYIGKLELDYVYFSNEVAKILDEFESRYVCMTRGELIPEMDSEEEESFVESEIFRLAENLRENVKKVMRDGKISA